MLMTTDRFLAIISIVIGLPAIVGLFLTSEHRVQGILWVTIIGLLIAWLVWWKWLQEQPQFDCLELRKAYKITALDGTLATYTRTETIRANVRGISEWWNRGLINDGTITDILINSQKPSLTEVEAGATDVCRRFDRPLEKNEETQVVMTCTFHNAFIKPKESVIHMSASRVKEVVIIVELPKPCIKAEVRRTYSGDHGKLLPPPKITVENTRIEATIKKPRMGASYHVEWSW